MSMMTTTHPLARLESERPAASPATAVRPWGFWATLGWFGVAVATFIAANFLCGFGYVIWFVLTHPGAAINVESQVLHHLAIAVAMPAAALVLMLAARRGGSVSNYLGLVLPHGRDVLIGLAALAALWGISFVLFMLFPAYDQSGELIREYRATLGNPTALMLNWLTLVVTAPVAEEIIFRGFLMRGWSASRLGPVGAVVLSSAAFAVVHVQYNVPTMFMVFSLGLLFGVMRWRTGSTTLTILLHAAWNLSAGLYYAWHA